MNRRDVVATVGASFIASASARKTMGRTTAFPANAAIQASNASPRRYQPNWTSLKQHTCPRWYEDAKLGIFIHYGLYSVPAWAPTTKLTERGEVDWHKFPPDLSDWFTNDPNAQRYQKALHTKRSPHCQN